MSAIRQSVSVQDELQHRFDSNQDFLPPVSRSPRKTANKIHFQMVRILPLDLACAFRVRKHAVSIASLTPRQAKAPSPHTKGARMRRMVFSVGSALLISSGFALPAMAMDHSTSSFEEMAILASGGQESADSHSLYYRPGRPSRPGYRGVQCKAVNQRGAPFYGRGRNMPEARDAALRSCYQVSRSCWMDGCRSI